jgi:hypothetical protein
MSLRTPLTFANVLHRLFYRFTVLRLQAAGSASGQRSSLLLALALVRSSAVFEPWHTCSAMRLTPNIALKTDGFAAA